MSLEDRLTGGQTRMQRVKEYVAGCLDSDNARLYGTFRERAALNITQFPKIQASLLIRMGLIYPLASYLIDKAGLPPDAKAEILGATINYHTWAAGYLAYVVEIQAGLSKYPIEALLRLGSKLQQRLTGKEREA